ncbi:hypothetical protein [Saccharomonospora iraqiensis]|uniref:hypothetical protein n=1 Tax=Saccharomonospora iraqiensis TaxID=52698 RepID=UPI00041BD5C3|nr:hypothetical protein [Saccharomonospora iraqiensis]
MAETVVQTGAGAQRRLRGLGLELDFFDRAIRAGIAAMSNNDFEPQNAPGLKDWIARVGTLREHLVRDAGWNYANPFHMPLVYDPARKNALGVLQGDAHTGLGKPESGPRSRYPKGPAIAVVTAAADDGVSPLDLDLTQSTGRGHLDPRDLRSMDVWFLVTYTDTVSDALFVVHRELSLAHPTNPDDHVNSWRERLLFAPMTCRPPWYRGTRSDCGGDVFFDGRAGGDEVDEDPLEGDPAAVSSLTRDRSR